MSYTEIFSNEEIFKVFESEFGFFSVVAQDNEGYMLCKDLPDLDLGALPLYSFAFLTPDRAKVNKHLLISHDGLQLYFRLTENTPRLKEFSKEFDDELGLFKPVGILDLTKYLDPIDCIAPFVDRRINRLTIVRISTGIPVGLLIWFEIGTRMALVTSNLSELMLLFGDNVDMLYEEAIYKKGFLNLNVETKEFRPANYPKTFRRSNDWFEY